MTNEFLVRTLEALEAQAQLLAAQIRTLRSAIPQEQVEEPETDSDGACLHPEDKRRPLTAFGNEKRWRCLRCGVVGGTKEKHGNEVV